MDKNVIDQNKVRQVIYILLILFLGVLLALEVSLFLPALLGALTLYVLLRRQMFYLTEKKKWKKGLAVVFLMLISFFIIMIPVGLLINMLSSKVSHALHNSAQLTAALKKVIYNVESQYGFIIASEENINKLGNVIAQNIPKILGATFHTLTTIVFIYFILYFMLMNSRSMERAIYEYLPLKNENISRIGNEIRTMVYSNAVGIPIIAIAQGLVGLVGYLIIGVNQPFFWFGVTCIASMLPVVGAALAYVPLAIMFFANGQNGQGIAMLIYGFGVIGLVDNVLRFSILKKMANVHQLITVFGVIIGLNLFGFLGLIFGPLVISMFILLLKIYFSEFVVKQRSYQSMPEN